MNAKQYHYWVLPLLALIGFVDSSCSQETNAARHLAKANQYFQAGSYEKAEIEYKNALQLNAQNPLATKRLGIIYADQGRFERAGFFLAQARRQNTNDLEVRIRYASLLVSVGRYREARQDALFVLGKSLEYPDAFRVLALTATTTNLILETRQRLEQLQQRVGDKGDLEVSLGLLWLRQLDFKAAETAFKKALVLDPKSAEAYSGLANVSWVLKDLATAEQYFKKAADLTPIGSGKALGYALFKLGTGATPEAKTMFREITRQAPDYLPAQRVLAGLALNELKLDECSQIIKGILAREPIDYEAILMRSRLEMAQHKPAEAISTLTRLTLMYTNSAQAFYHLGVAYLANNESAKAVDALRQVSRLDTNHVDTILLLAQQDIRRGDIATAIASLKQLARRQPPIPEAFMMLANAYQAGHEPEEALAVYRRLMALVPKAPEPAIQMGLVLLSVNRTAEARQALEKAAEVAPGNLAALEMLVNLDLNDHKYQTALQRVQPLLEKDPNGVAPMLLQARIFQGQTNYPQAEAILNKVITLAPATRSAYVLLAEIYVVTHREQEALAKLQTVVSKRTNDWPAFMMIGTIQFRLKNFSEAGQAYERALVSNPNDVLVLNNLACLYCEQLNQPERAFQLAQRAQTLAPKDPSVADTLAWILCQRGEYGRALVLMQENAEKLLTYPEAQYHLAMTHYMMGEEVPARMAFERALQSKQEFPGREACERRLAFLKLDPDSTDLKTMQDLEKRTAELPGNPSGDPVLLARLARVSEKSGAFEKARDAYEMGLKLNPRAVPNLMKLAQLYAEHLNDPKRALELAKEARTLAPDDAEIAYFLGRLAFQAGDHPWAASLLQQSVLKLANQPEVFYHLARAQFSMGQIAEAKTSLQSALQSGGTFSHAAAARNMLELIGLYSDTAPIERSAGRVQEILKTEPGDGTALAVAALLFDRQGNQAAAKQAYEKALTLLPFFGPAVKRLAVLYAESPTDEKRAYEWAAKARKAFPTDPEVAKALGMAEFKRGDYARATQLLNESAKTRNEDGEVYFYLGMAHYRAKENKEATDDLRRALALNLRKDLADEAKRTLTLLK